MPLPTAAAVRLCGVADGLREEVYRQVQHFVTPAAILRLRAADATGGAIPRVGSARAAAGDWAASCVPARRDPRRSDRVGALRIASSNESRRRTATAPRPLRGASAVPQWRESLPSLADAAWRRCTVTVISSAAGVCGTDTVAVLNRSACCTVTRHSDEYGNRRSSYTSTWSIPAAPRPSVRSHATSA